MRLFKGIKDTYKKSEAAVIAQNLPAHVAGDREQVAQRGAAVGRRPDSREGDRLGLIGEGQEDNAGCRQQRRGGPDDGDAEALSDHGQQRAAPHVEAQDRRRGPASGMAQHDMAMNLRAGAAMPNKERLARQIGPCNGRPLGERMLLR